MMAELIGSIDPDTLVSLLVKALTTTGNKDGRTWLEIIDSIALDEQEEDLRVMRALVGTIALELLEYGEETIEETSVE